MKQMFVQRVKEKEAILKEAEREVNVVRCDVQLLFRWSVKLEGSSCNHPWKTMAHTVVFK